MHYLRLYARFIIVYIKTCMEYRFAFFMDIFIQVITFYVMYLGIWIMLNRFETIQGWGFYEVLFLYNLNILSHGLSGLFFWAPMRNLEGMIQRGEFDGILTRPIPSFLHIVFKQFTHVFLGHILLSGTILVICIQKLNIEWSAYKSVMLAIVILGAMLIQASVKILAGCVSFWTVKSTSFMDTMIYGFRHFINYPVSIYHFSVQFFLTFILPYGFINFYPSLMFLKKDSDALFWNGFQYGTPVVGVLLFSLSLVVWTIATNKYQSAGS